MNFNYCNKIRRINLIQPFLTLTPIILSISNIITYSFYIKSIYLHKKRSNIFTKLFGKLNIFIYIAHIFFYKKEVFMEIQLLYLSPFQFSNFHIKEE